MSELHSCAPELSSEMTVTVLGIKSHRLKGCRAAGLWRATGSQAPTCWGGSISSIYANVSLN